MTTRDPAYIFVPPCARCGDAADVIRPDDDAPETFACDWCGSVTEDGGTTWTEATLMITFPPLSETPQ